MFPLPYRKKIKLITAKDGSIHYPHSFSVGMMLILKIEAFPTLHKIQGYGIISETSLHSIVVFWQNTGEYKSYTIASAVLNFDKV